MTSSLADELHTSQEIGYQYSTLGFCHHLGVQRTRNDLVLCLKPTILANLLQHARVDSTRAISNVMAAMIRDPLGPAAASQLDSDLAAFALVSGAMEVIAGWLRGDFDTSREHLADIVAGLLLAVADISTALPGHTGES